MENRHVDLKLLAERLSTQDTSFLQNPNSVIDMNRAFRQSKKDLVRFDSAVDVLSLHQLKQQISDEFGEQDAKVLSTVVDYVSEQSKYLSNSDRKRIKMKDFLSDHHFTS
jgi:hypothetical protein